MAGCNSICWTVHMEQVSFVYWEKTCKAYKISILKCTDPNKWTNYDSLYYDVVLLAICYACCTEIASTGRSTQKFYFRKNTQLQVKVLYSNQYSELYLKKYLEVLFLQKNRLSDWYIMTYSILIIRLTLIQPGASSISLSWPAEVESLTYLPDIVQSWFPAQGLSPPKGHQRDLRILRWFNEAAQQKKKNQLFCKGPQAKCCGVQYGYPHVHYKMCA